MNDTNEAGTVQNSGLPDIGGLVSGGFAFARRRLDLVGWFALLYVGIAIGAIFVAALLIGAGFLLFSEVTVIAIVLAVILLIASLVLWSVVGVLLNSSLVYVCASEEGTSFWAGWSWGWHHLWSVLWVGLLYMLISMTGILLFIIPGIVIGVYCLFYLFVLIFEDVRGINALVRSTQLVYGQWWGVFGRVLLFGVLAWVASMAVSVIAAIFAEIGNAVDSSLGLLLSLAIQFAGFFVSLFMSVILVHAVGQMYHSLATHKGPFDASAPSTARTLYTVMAALMLAALLSLSVWAGTFMGSGTATQMIKAAIEEVENAEDLESNLEDFSMEVGEGFELNLDSGEEETE